MMLHENCIRQSVHAFIGGVNAGILDDSSDDEDHAVNLDNGEHPIHEAATGTAPAA